MSLSVPLFLCLTLCVSVSFSARWRWAPSCPLETGCGQVSAWDRVTFTCLEFLLRLSFTLFLPPCLYLCLFVSVCLCFSVPVCPARSLSLCVCFSAKWRWAPRCALKTGYGQVGHLNSVDCLAFTRTRSAIAACLPVFRSVSLSAYVCLSLRLPRPPFSVCLPVCACLPVCLPACLSPFLTVSHCVLLSLT